MSKEQGAKSREREEREVTGLMNRPASLTVVRMEVPCCGLRMTATTFFGPIRPALRPSAILVGCLCVLAFEYACLRNCGGGPEVEIVHRDSDYALRALACLTPLSAGEYLTSAQLARAGSVPVAFIRKLLRRLVAENIVEAIRGARGGYRLARPADSIRFLEILEAAQGKLAINRCFGTDEKCPRRSKCSVRPRLAKLQAAILREFSAVTLRALTADHL